MIPKFFKTIISIIIAVASLGLVVILLSIGLVTLWYLFLIGLAIWGIRRLYYFFKGEKPPTFVQQYSYYSNRTQTTGKTKQGRVIDYDEFKDK
ncbi:MAG: hypothetical protein WC748_04120 [Legionellales bacterium]|jgi:membrane protein implicated in regulation of membrane protease activity